MSVAHSLVALVIITRSTARLRPSVMQMFDEWRSKLRRKEQERKVDPMHARASEPGGTHRACQLNERHSAAHSSATAALMSGAGRRYGVAGGVAHEGEAATVTTTAAHRGTAAALHGATGS